MRHHVHAAVALALILLCAAPAGARGQEKGESPLGAQGVRFQENRGQVVDTEGRPRGDIRFVADAPGARLYFRENGISYVFLAPPPAEAADANRGAVSMAKAAVPEPPRSAYRLDMTLVGGNPAVRIHASDMAPGYVNFYLGHCPEGITGVREFRRLVYENVYEHIDLELLSMNGRVKYNFVVRPGGNVSDIRMRYEGEQRAALTDAGALSVVTPLGSLEEAAPYTYAGRADREVRSRFLRTGNVVGFEVAPYDRSQTLVIDPWATYYGGASGDPCYSISVDQSGNTIIVGSTQSADFPTSVGAYQTSFAGLSDGYIVKFDASGQRIWATYFGGSDREWADDLAVDGDGSIIVSGVTWSADLPVSAGAFQTINRGSGDAFLAKFDASGAWVWATFFGGRGEERGDVTRGTKVALDGNGNIVITGSTESKDLPVTPGAFQLTKGSGPTSDAYLAKFTGGGGRIWATYYGGAAEDRCHDIAIDAQGNIIIAGWTHSADFPVSAGAFQGVRPGSGDGFIVKMSASGNRIWATYYGGSGFDMFAALTIDENDAIVLAGYTNSVNFPVTTGAFQTVSHGNNDVTVVKFDGQGGRIFASYFGGSSGDEAYDVYVNSAGCIFLTGTTSSVDLPVAYPFQSTYGGSVDAFVSKFDPMCSGILWSTYYGGTGSDLAHGITGDTGGNIGFAGSTSSSDFPLWNACQPTRGGSSDAFVVWLDGNGMIPGFNRSPVAVAGASPAQGTAPLAVAFDGASSYDPDGSVVSYAWSFGDGGTSADMNPGHTYTTAGTYTATLTVTDDDGATGTAGVQIVVTTAGAYVYVAQQTVTRVAVSSTKYKGVDQVLILDGANQPAAGAVVTATYSGPNSGTVSGTTDASGTVTLQTAVKNNPSGQWCFTVTDVQKSGYAFNTSLGVLTACEAVPKAVPVLPSALALSVRPNPFNPVTTLSISVPAASNVRLRVFDIRGRMVATVLEEWMRAGEHHVVFDGAQLPSGWYFCRLETEYHVVVETMILLK